MVRIEKMPVLVLVLVVKPCASAISGMPSPSMSYAAALIICD